MVAIRRCIFISTFFFQLFFLYFFYWYTFLLPFIKQVLKTWLINKFMETILQEEDLINSEKLTILVKIFKHMY